MILYLTEQKIFYSFNQNSAFSNYLTDHKIISFTMIYHTLGYLSNLLWIISHIYEPQIFIIRLSVVKLIHLIVLLMLPITGGI